MTREEHLKWCRERALREYDYYTGADKQRNGLTSMMSDMGKHPETNSRTLAYLCLNQMTVPMTREQFIEFIEGFN